ncbi:MAG: hypothetical protein Q8S43_11265 [Actinomycetota bacterium]|nr:MAG: hypothetical protein FD171_304 [Actinomycetota bacterium]MDO8950321.1 hypothetical protein [Actinomycetota bacterium]MDP3631512.1 hypothetical protein [Actinomycetota bacterium]
MPKNSYDSVIGALFEEILMALRRHLSELQREALWKWRWLGWSNATPAFKASIYVLIVAAAVVAALPILVR